MKYTARHSTVIPRNARHGTAPHRIASNLKAKRYSHFNKWLFRSVLQAKGIERHWSAVRSKARHRTAVHGIALHRSAIKSKASCLFQRGGNSVCLGRLSVVHSTVVHSIAREGSASQGRAPKRTALQRNATQFTTSKSKAF